MDCIFCQIVQKKIPSFLLYEDNDIMAVLDIYPTNPGHILIFPKKHIESYEQLPDYLIGKIFTLAKYLMIILKNVVNPKGFNVFVSSGQVAGQRTPHIAVHIIPRFENDNINLSWPRKQVSPQFLKQLQDTISQAIASANFLDKQQQTLLLQQEQKTMKEEKQQRANSNNKKSEIKKDYRKMLEWFYRNI